MTSKSEISSWFDRGVESGATHMIVVCDTFDYEDYPVFVMPDDNIETKLIQYRGNMQRVMEVYNMKLDKQTQLNEHRAYHIE